MIRRTLVAVAIVVASIGVAGSAAIAQDDLPDECRTIIGCADAGPAPENPGDRGGYAQLLTLAVLAGGVGFIAWRIVKSSRAATSASG
ncbi:MAG: hypothetical protein AAF548_14335 [Actinomycetota bacterium]